VRKRRVGRKKRRKWYFEERIAGWWLRGGKGL
jgi:hypothetical protein